MLLDPLFDRFVRRLKLSRREQPNISETRKPKLSIRVQESDHPYFLGPRKPNSRQPGPGTLTGATNFVMNQPTLVDNVIENQQIIQNFAAGKSGRVRCR